MAIDLANDIQTAKEIILIRDEGCIVNYTRKIQPWFDEILRQNNDYHNPIFLLSSRYRPLPDESRKKTYLFPISVPELNFGERCGLFKRLIKFEGITLTQEDFHFFTGLLQGFPDQVRFSCDLVRDLGVAGAKKEAYQITEYNADKVAVILAKYAEQPKVMDFLYLLSDFEFISLDFLFSIAYEIEYIDFLNEFIATAICDFIGIEKEFIRLNDAIRDYVRRNRLQPPDIFQRRLKDHLNIFLKAHDEEERDVSVVIYSMKEAIKAGKTVPQQYLIPSHFLKSMRELYQERGNLNRVIELADILLEKEHILDITVAQDVRYYLCLSLARKRDSRMLNIVQKIQGVEHDFLLGFYYRLQNRPTDAIQRLKRCLDYSVVASRAKRELVQVYLSIDDYESAYNLAQSNYEENRRNPFHIQAYFNAIINSPQALREQEVAFRLIGELESINTDLAAEMANIAKAEYVAKFQDNYVSALDIINDAVNRFTKSYYPLLAKAFLTARYKDLENLRESVGQLEIMVRDRYISDLSITKLKCYIFAMDGNLPKAMEYAERYLKRLPEYSLISFKQKLHDIST